MSSPRTGFARVWRFKPREESRQTFEQMYGPAGAWAVLFSRDPEWLETELWGPDTTRGFYLTVDWWTSEQAFAEFKARWREDYDTLDATCSELTESEEEIGTFLLGITPSSGGRSPAS